MESGTDTKRSFNNARHSKEQGTSCYYTKPNSVISNQRRTCHPGATTITTKGGQGLEGLKSNDCHCIQDITIQSDVVKISFLLNEGKDNYGAIQTSTDTLLKALGSYYKYDFVKIS